MWRWLFNLIAVVSTLLFTTVIAVWLWSFTQTPPVSAPVSGLSPVAPVHAIILPIPADADEYVVPMRGRFQRWEYTPWDNKWYRAGDVPVWIPAILFLVIPGAWLVLRRLRDDAKQLPQPTAK